MAKYLTIVGATTFITLQEKFSFKWGTQKILSDFVDINGFDLLNTDQIIIIHV